MGFAYITFYLIRGRRSLVFIQSVLLASKVRPQKELIIEEKHSKVKGKNCQVGLGIII